MSKTTQLLRVIGNFLFSTAAIIYTALSYNAGGFNMGFGVLLILCALIVSTQLMILFRRIGTLACWAAVTGLAVLAILLAKDAGTGLLIATCSLSIPFAVTLFWPAFREIGALAKTALPAAGGILFLGTLGYNYFHFGLFSFAPMMARTTETVTKILEQWEALLVQAYGKDLPAQLLAYTEAFREQANGLAFNLLLMPVFALFGIFFVAVFLADHKAKKEGARRWCGSWSVLIPERRISWLYMLINIFSAFVGDGLYLPLSAALNLFGFFYVFTAIYKLERYLAKKQLRGIWRGLIVFVLGSLSLFTVGGAALTPYTVLLFAGWWIATAPVRATVIRK